MLTAAHALSLPPIGKCQTVLRFRCVAWLCVLTILCSSGSAAENLLVNPGFEEGDTEPTGWTVNPRHTDSRIARDAGRGAQSAPSMSVTNLKSEDTGNVYQTVVVQPPLEAGSVVRFSARAGSTGGGAPKIIVQMYDKAGARQIASASIPGPGEEFTAVAGYAVLQRRVEQISVYLCNYAVGTVWWDDAVLQIERVAARRIIPRPTSSGPQHTLTTGDGLALTLASNGAVTGLSLDGRQSAVSGMHSGLWLKPYGEDILPVVGDVTTAGQTVRQEGNIADRSLRVRATYQACDDHILCRGEVEDLTGTDTALDVLLAVPVGEEGWRWGQSIRQERPIEDGPHTLDVTTFSSVSRPQSDEGLALAVPADFPCDCEFTHDPKMGHVARIRLGLSPAAGGRLKSRAPFRFALYRCNGRWGLRDAARRYYELYPEAFVKRVSREGLWLFGTPRFPLPDPENYAFREGGPGGWERDDEHGIYTCPYIIPGQREITHLDRLPADRQEALTLLRDYTPKPSSRSESWTTAMKPIIESCMLRDAEGRPQVRIRNTFWGGNSVTFPLNASPSLFADRDRPTIAQSLLAQTKALHAEFPALDGIYVDSLGAWGDYLNFRREHFAYTRVPLTYDPSTGRPVLHNRFGLLEFLWALRDQMHEGGKLLFANGVHQNRRFHFFALDILGVEGRSWLEQKRVMASQKPFVLLIYNIHDDPAQMEHWFNLCALYGIYPSFGSMKVFNTPEEYAPVAALNNRFVPALQTITRAGWQPVGHARCPDTDIWVERWGGAQGGGCYLTVYNSAQEDRVAHLAVDVAELQLKGDELTATGLVSDVSCSAAVSDGQARLTLDLPAQRVRVLHLVGR